MITRVGALVIALVFTATPALSADSANRFAVKGIGLLLCRDFVAAREVGGDQVIAFNSWSQGFLSSLNLYEEDTFDIAPWQSPDLLQVALNRYCVQNPEVQYFQAVIRLGQALAPKRLREASPMVAVKDADAETIVYEAVIRDLQSALKREGLLRDEEPSGAFTEATRAALGDYQRRNGIDPTGLPDQVSLYRLLQNIPADNGR